MTAVLASPCAKDSAILAIPRYLRPETSLRPLIPLQRRSRAIRQIRLLRRMHRCRF